MSDPRSILLRRAAATLLTTFLAISSVTPLHAHTTSNSSLRGGPQETYVDFDSQVYSVRLDGERAYVIREWLWGGGWGGYIVGSTLSILDLGGANPRTPLARMDLWSGPRTMALEGGLAYLVGNYDFRIVDVSDPASLHEVGAIAAWPPGLAGCVAVGDRNAYVGCEGAVYVVDVSDPTLPKERGSVSLPAPVTCVAASGSVVYVGISNGEIAVLDVSNPVEVHVVATLSTQGVPHDMEIRGSHVYVADGQAGLQILDVSRPGQPRVVGGVDTPGDAGDISVIGARAYIADGGLRVIDISNPARPAIVDFLPGEEISAVSVSQSRVAVGGPHQVSYDCIGSVFPGCPPDGYVWITPRSRWEAAERGASNANAWSASLAAAPPAASALRGNQPNPFNPATTIRYDVASPSQVRISIHDVQGRNVRTLVDGARPAGRHEVTWNGRNESGEPAASGIYFVRMDVENVHQLLKISLLK